MVGGRTDGVGLDSDDTGLRGLGLRPGAIDQRMVGVEKIRIPKSEIRMATWVNRQCNSRNKKKLKKRQRTAALQNAGGLSGTIGR